MTNSTTTTSNENVKESNERAPPPEFAARFVSPKFLLMFGLSVNAALIIEGIVCFSVCVLNVRSYILSFYYILFGLFSIGAEYEFKFIGKYAQILLSRTGRGFWYLFLGTLSLGREWWAIIVALLLILAGLLNICAVLRPELNVDADKERPISEQDGNQRQALKRISQSQSIQDLKPLQKAYDAAHEQQPGSLPPRNNAYDDY